MPPEEELVPEEEEALVFVLELRDFFPPNQRIKWRLWQLSFPVSPREDFFSASISIWCRICVTIKDGTVQRISWYLINILTTFVVPARLR